MYSCSLFREITNPKFKWKHKFCSIVSSLETRLIHSCLEIAEKYQKVKSRKFGLLGLWVLSKEWKISVLDIVCWENWRDSTILTLRVNVLTCNIVHLGLIWSMLYFGLNRLLLCPSSPTFSCVGPFVPSTRKVVMTQDLTVTALHLRQYQSMGCLFHISSQHRSIIFFIHFPKKYIFEINKYFKLWIHAK